jgi:hypothetical protein
LKFENHSNYNCEIETDSGQTYRVFANWMHNQHLDAWQGWQCEAGASRLYIDKNLNVWSGECKNDILGHALDGFEVLEHTICKRSTCTGCTDDLAVIKRKIDHD